MRQGERLDILVLVIHSDGVWYEGFLEHWRRDVDGWLGFVRYTVGVGMTHIGWFDEALIYKCADMNSPATTPEL